MNNFFLIFFLFFLEKIWKLFFCYVSLPYNFKAKQFIHLKKLKTMKKITLFVAAMAVMFMANAGSKLSFGDAVDLDGTETIALFDKVTGQFIDEANLADYSPYQLVTFGVKVEDATLKAWLQADEANRFLVFAPNNFNGSNGVDWRSVNFDDRWDNRFKRYKTTDIYYIEIYAATLFTNTLTSGSDTKPGHGTSWATVVDKVGTAGAEFIEGSLKLVENGYLLIAGDVFGVEYSTTEKENGRPKVVNDPWNGDNKTESIALYGELGNFFIKLAGNAGKASYNAAINPFTGTVGKNGFADAIANEQNAEVVGFYSILGAKLAGEPASGIYLVKFSNGKTVKLVK